MNVTISRDGLSQGLYLAQGVVQKRHTIPILANVLMEATERSLSVTATDMEIGVRRRCEATVKKRGAVTLNARKLYEIVREMEADEVGLNVVADGRVEVTGGRSRFTMVSLDAKDYPNLAFDRKDEATKIRVTGALLAGMIDRTAFCVSVDENRFNLSGVLVEIPEPNKLRFVGTDGHRLGVVTRSIGGVEPGQTLIVPRKGMLELRRLLDGGENKEVEITLSQKELRLHDNDVDIFTRAVEGEFPDYHQVLPKGISSIARLSRDEFLSAVRRVSLVASERTPGLRLQLESGRIVVSARSPDLGEAVEEIEAEYDGKAVAVGFNARYLQDVLAVHGEGERIEMGVTDAVGPGTVKSEEDPDYTYVLMPMRL